MKKRYLLLLFSTLIATYTFGQVVITAVFDGPLSGGLPKGVELFALENIADLSPLGIGSANNGGGTDSVEFSFPADAVSAGDYFYVSSDSAGFEAFFGFPTDYNVANSPNSFAISINGDDAVELFWNGVVIDVFGDINVDGNGEPWEYQDGWAARKAMTGPDGSTFVLQNWNYSGPGGLAGESSNASAANPVPLQSYGTIVEPDTVVILQNLLFIPRDLTISVGQTVRFTNVETDVVHNVNGALDFYGCNPQGFFSGAAVVGLWDFDVTFNQAGFYDYHCDPHLACCDMVGTITVVDANAPSFPSYDISTVTTEDGNGVADSIGTMCTLEGTVYGESLVPNGLLFTMIDDSGNGITVVDFSNTCYPTATEGDRLSVMGTIQQFNGLIQISAEDLIEVVSEGNALLDPIDVSGPLGENTESKFIRVSNVTVDSVVATGVSGWNADGSNGINNYTIRIDADLIGDEAFVMGLAGQTVTVTGIGGQFDTSDEPPLSSGYQIVPRRQSDIEVVASIPLLSKDAIEVFPNPTSGILYYQTDQLIDRIDVFNLEGKRALTFRNQTQLNLSQLDQGMYIIKFIAREGVLGLPVLKVD